MAVRFFTEIVLSLLLGTSAYALTFDNDVPSAVQAQMTQDLNFMSQIQGTQQTKLHQQIFGTVDGANYKKFFESHIRAVGYDNCGGGGAVACVQPMQGSDKMWLTDNFIKINHPQIARMMVVYHEARHAERNNGNWQHATCPRPFRDSQGKDMTSIWTGTRLEGQPACDSTAFGSYGSSTIMLENISLNCANCTEKVKLDAGVYAADQLDRITDANSKAEMIADLNGDKVHF